MLSAVAGLYMSLQAENVVIPIWGHEEKRTLTWHFDTLANGNAMWYANDYHWDTLVQTGFVRTDGIQSQAITLNPWTYDGCKLYLKVRPQTTTCSTKVYIRLGTDDSMYIAKRDSAVGTLEKIISFMPYYDNDSLILMDRMEIRIVAGDTTTDTTAEYSKWVEVTGKLFGKD